MHTYLFVTKSKSVFSSTPIATTAPSETLSALTKFVDIRISLFSRDICDKTSKFVFLVIQSKGLHARAISKQWS